VADLAAQRGRRERAGDRRCELRRFRRAGLHHDRIGGNDAGFTDIIFHCLGKWDIGDCSNDAGFTSDRINIVWDDVYPRLVATFWGLREAFPNATIAAFGYPSVLDPTLRCGDLSVGPATITANEADWLENTFLLNVNQAVAEAAAEAGVTYIDITNVTRHHEICSADPWFNGLQVTNHIASAHPTVAAHDHIAAYFLQHYVVNGRLTFTNPPAQFVIPVDPSPPPRLILGSIAVNAGTPCGASCLQPTVCAAGCSLQIQGGGFQPGSQLQATVYSNPVPLGTVTADGNGDVDATLAVPAGLEIGTHRLELVGTAADGRGQESTTFFSVQAPAAPVVLARPSVTGTGAAGDPLTCVDARFFGYDAPAVHRVWLRDGGQLTATDATYAPLSADVGHAIACRSDATNGGGTTTSVSDAITVGDHVPPTATITRPPCRRHERRSACASRLRHAAAWTTLRGVVRDPRPSGGGQKVTIRIARRLASGKCATFDRHAWRRTACGKRGRTVVVAAPAGRWQLRLRKVVAARYDVTAVARDAGGNVQRKAARVRFTIVPVRH